MILLIGTQMNDRFIRCAMIMCGRYPRRYRIDRVPFQIHGTDGFERSGNRQALRDFFDSAAHIAFTAVTSLIERGRATASD